ncbi:MAG: methyl-accepting chemotaxis protein, partial [Oscillospiraceae bacterium]
AFEQLGKNTPESRNINCFACGYGSCLKLAAAVADGNNDVRNCVNYSRIKLKSGKDEFDTIFKSLEDRISGINDNLENIIGSSLDLDKISIQTRLISLNASIESAHAGEYGKCFAVVASEIKNLADKSEIIVGSNKDKQESIVRDIQTFEKEIKAIKEKIDGILQ